MTKEDRHYLAYLAMTSTGWLPDPYSCFFPADRATRLSVTGLRFSLLQVERLPLSLYLYRGSHQLEVWRLGRIEAIFSWRARQLRRLALLLLDRVLRDQGPTVEEQCQEVLNTLRSSPSS